MRNMSITVSAKKDGGDWKITNDLGLTLSMAPPLYDDIVPQEENEPPPSYDTLRFKQTANIQEESMVTNECITVACIETLNPSTGFRDDVLCEEVLGPGNVPCRETVFNRQETQIKNKWRPLNSSDDVRNVTSSECLFNSDYKIKNTAGVNSDDSEIDEETNIARTAETEINTSNKMCSQTSSQCSMETGFASMESNSSRDSGSESSPRHDGNDHTSMEDQEDGRSLLVRYKKQVSRGSESDIQFIDELSENSNIIN